MKQHASLVVIAAACAALLAAPALAQNAGGDHMKGMNMSSQSHAKKSMKMARARGMKLTCMDYAWQSQDQKDCEAGKIKPPSWR
ncbi:MAG TPA: hypothetical protein VFA22_11975 [Stellaceae bacterium]|nr:hypothetical protein [Stellaceae bacterium]